MTWEQGPGPVVLDPPRRRGLVDVLRSKRLAFLASASIVVALAIMQRECPEGTGAPRTPEMSRPAPPIEPRFDDVLTVSGEIALDLPAIKEVEPDPPMRIEWELEADIIPCTDPFPDLEHHKPAPRVYVGPNDRTHRDRAAASRRR